MVVSINGLRGGGGGGGAPRGGGGAPAGGAGAGGGAPPAVRELIAALAAHDFYVELGAFSMYAGTSTAVTSLQEILGRSLEQVRETDAIAPSELLGDLEPAATLELGADPGGMSVFGLGWSRGRLELLVVEIEDPTPDNVIRRFDAPEAFLDFVEDRLDDDDEDVKATLAALRGGTSGAAAPPAAPAPALVQVENGTPANPWAKAQKLLGTTAVIASETTAGGRQVMVQRRGSATALRVEVLDPDGARRPVTLAAEDVYGVAVHPTEERALLCLGAPGPLLEVDLVSLAAVELRPRVGWRAGYVDATHIATLTEGRLELFRAGEAPLGGALQSFDCGGNNLLVAPGRCYVVHGKNGGVGVFTLGPGGLVAEATLPVDGRPIHYLSASSTRAGASFLGSCAWDGKWTWYRLR